MSDLSDIHKEIDMYMNVNRDRYRSFLSDLRSEVTDIRNRYDVNRLIYSIYSRSDKQKGDEIKSKLRIAQKLVQWRKEACDENKPTPKVSDIHDIVGITIVVNFPSDTYVVADYLERDRAFRSFNVKSRRVKESHGYHAIHLIVSNKSFAHFGLLGEIQIKTMLHDGWGAKIHDITYAPKGRINNTLRTHMEILGEVLRKLDDQSELIKNAIKNKWEIDRKRREACQHALLSQLQRHGGAAHDDELAALVTEIERNRDLFGGASFDSPQLGAIYTKITSLIDRIGPTWGVCRLMTYFASVRPNGDMNATAISYIEDWISFIQGDKIDQLHAMMFRSHAKYALGKFEDAAQDARAVLSRAEEIGQVDETAKAKATLAYFLAEVAVGMPNRSEELIAEARLLSEAALSSLPNDDAVKDTRGMVLIAFGENEECVREGLRICELAWRNAPDSQKYIAEPFFKLHERRAFRRLLEWD
jgi:ppGpp synthetase/RelA/SpoT-type nucleotidyltranferase